MVFKEEQYLRKIWLWPILLTLFVLFGVFGLIKVLSEDTGHQDPIAMIIIVFVLGFVLWLMLSMKLETRIDHYGLSFKSHPIINSWKKYRWEAIQNIETVSTRVIWGTGGIGIRYSLRGEWRYLFSLSNAVRVHLKDRTFVLSTQKPKELIATWKYWKGEDL